MKAEIKKTSTYWREERTPKQVTKTRVYLDKAPALALRDQAWYHRFQTE